MTYADSPLRCARSDIPATRGWWSGNAWISVNACSRRLSRLRPECPTLNQPCDGTRAAKRATMVRVGHVRQNLVRERVSGFGRLVVAKIDRAFGRAGRALRRAHRESAPGCSGGARVPCSGSGRGRGVPRPRVGGGRMRRRQRQQIALPASTIGAQRARSCWCVEPYPAAVVRPVIWSALGGRAS